MSYRIVVVDDDKVSLRLLEHTLTKAGFEVMTADSGPAGLKTIRDHIPDIVISDILLPVMDGFELTQRIKEDPKLARIKVIMMSAVYKNPAHRSDIFDSGADYFMAKPLDMPKLLDYLKEILMAESED